MVSPARLFALLMWTRPPEATCSERSQLSPSAYKRAAPYTVVGAASAVALSCKLPSRTSRGALKPEPTKSPCKRKVPAPAYKRGFHHCGCCPFVWRDRSEERRVGKEGRTGRG